jgi:hydroxymethylglutaryl-CoA synthase
VNRIAGYATYIPRLRLTRAAAREAWPQMTMPGQARSVPSLDEDALTMAAQAALDALDAASIAGGELAGVFLATTSSPYVVKSGAAIMADYVGAPDDASVTDFGAGSHAGLVALLSALRDDGLAQRGPILVVGSDVLYGAVNDPSDLGFGAAAAAFVVGRDGFAALDQFVYRYSSYSSTWQPVGDVHLRRYDDDRFERTAGYGAQMKAGLRAFAGGLDVAPARYAVSASASARADSYGVPADRVMGLDTVAEIGDSGCANALVAFAEALGASEPGEAIVVQAYGSGAGTVSASIAVESEWRAPARFAPERLDISYVQYAKHRGVLPLGALPSFGAPYAASPGWERGKHASVGLHAGRCRACGSLNFPPRAYCLDCRGQEFDDVTLPRRATVLTFNLQYVVGIAPEEAPLPICTALVDGEPAGRYGGKVAALVTDADVSKISIGTPLELVPRRGDVEEGLVKYGWKFRPRVGPVLGNGTLVAAAVEEVAG